MLLRSIALAAIALASTAVAQCGTNLLTTAPGLSNNSGAAGGCIYFQLNVLNPNGVSICGIRANTNTAAGVHMGATVHRHLTVTDPFLLTSVNVTAANWDTLCGLSGTANVVNTLSPMSVISGTGTLDLAPGLHLLAINACPSWANAYTNGAPALQTFTDGNLTYYGGRATNLDFSGTPFGTATLARVSNVAFDYTIPAVPVTTTPAGFAGVCSTTASVGTGCTSSVGASIHELFASTPDLIVPGVSSQDVIFSDAGGTVSVVAVPGTPIVPPSSPNLALGDDVNTPLIAMGFTASLGGRSFSDISMASNGYVWLGGLGAADFSPTAAELTAQGARFAPYWFDFAPNLGGTTHVDVLPGLVRVTWLNCWGFGGTGPEATVQLEITAASCLVRYDAFGGAYTSTASSRIVGFSNGVTHTAPAPVDLNGGAVPPVTGAVSNVNPVLVTTSLVFAGGTGTWTATGLDATGISATLAEIGFASGPILLPSPPFAANCNQRVTAGAAVLGLFINTASGAVSISIPGGPAFIGLPIVLQSATIGGSAWAVSNAVNNTVGL